MTSYDTATKLETTLAVVLFLVLLIPALAYAYQALAPAPLERSDYVACQIHAADQAAVAACIESFQP